MIQLAFTGFLAGLAALAIPIVLHFLRNKPTKRTPFPSLRFLHATVARRSANNKLRKWLVLLLRCICLTALVLAFCMPYLSRFAKQPDSATIVLWDQSFSMQAQTCRDALQDECRKLLNSADKKNPMLLGMVSDRVNWAGTFTGNAKELNSAFDALKPAEGSSSFEKALRLADSRLAVMLGKRKKIVIITDQQALPWKTLQWEKKLSPGVQLHVITPSGRSCINAAITDLALQSPYKGANSKVSLTARLKNFSDQTLQGDVRCLLDGKEIAREAVELSPYSEQNQAFQFAGEKEHHAVELQLRVNDELSTDNHRYLALNPATLPQICATPETSSDTDFLQKAFNPTKASASVSWNTWSEEELNQSDLLIIRDASLLRPDTGRKIKERLSLGGSAVLIWNDAPEMRNLLHQFGISVDSLQDKQTKELDYIDFDHPIFKPFLEAQVGRFFNILFFNPPSLHLPDDAQVLAAFKDKTPAIAELNVGKGKLLIVASGMNRKQTDWPTYATFLPFWREVLSYCQTKQPTAISLRVSSIPVSLQGLTQAQRLDTGERIEIGNGQLPLDRSGNVLINASTIPNIVSINVPSEESNPVQLDAGFPWKNLVSHESVKSTPMENLPMDQGKHFWRIIFVVAILAALGEMLLANRTVL